MHTHSHLGACSVRAQATVLELLDNCGIPGVVGCMALEEVRARCSARAVSLGAPPSWASGLQHSGVQHPTLAAWRQWGRVRSLLAVAAARVVQALRAGEALVWSCTALGAQAWCSARLMFCMLLW